MAWVTTIGPDADQIDYRLHAESGCSLSVDDDGQVAYRLDSDRPLEWIGEGLREVGIEPGTTLDDAGKAAAKVLADGKDPRDRRVALVKPKKAVDPRAKLPAGPLVDAVAAAADAAGVTPAALLNEPRIAARYGRMLRGLARSPQAHRVPVSDLQRIADAAGVDLAEVYPAADLDLARAHADRRVRVGNRGYDLTLDLPKSYSVLTALAAPELARELEDVYLDAVRETVSAMQGWAGYGMRGHHGDGQRAERVNGTGLLGWMTVHRTARPVPGAAPDPHLHAHLTLLNLVKGTDGKWSTIGAGGRDIHRHAHAADALVKARLRAMTHARWGMRWVRDERTGAWEVAAVPADLRTRMSKRAAQVEAAMRDAGVDPAAATARQQKVVAAQTKEAKQAPGAGGDLRAEWHRQARAAGVDPGGVVAAATPGPSDPPPRPSLRQAAAYVFRPEDGLTAHRKVTTRADVLAAVLDATGPAGVGALADTEQLVDEVLALDVAVALPPSGPVHLSNASRYTSTDVLDAERAVLAAARDRYASNTAVLDEQTIALAVAQFETANGFTLSVQQLAVLDRLAGAGHGVDAVIGVAGAGKTTLMAVLRSAYAATGQVVAGAATAAVAAQNLQSEAGIESRTIASWLHRIDAGPGLAGVDVLVVDEAAMVDDRHMARLLHAAGAAGVKVVGIGDPQQLKAVGVGGTFAAVHDLLGGLTLTENRRQRDVDERAALALWRTDARRQALHRWADTGRIHATDTTEAAHTDLIATWSNERTRWDEPHDRIQNLLVLAHTNADVDELNQRARAIRIAAGELPGPQRVYQLRDGGTLTLAPGDQVLLRVNDRRRQGVDVLNGFRGIVTALDDRGRAEVEWRQPGPDGPQLARAWVTPAYIAGGGVSLGYAITAAKAQGLTADRTLVYGNGMQANVLYPAMSRDRHRADLWLALESLEDPAGRARLGAPANATEVRQRAVDAYAIAVERDRPDGIVLAELGQAPQPITVRPVVPAPRRDTTPLWLEAQPVGDVDALAARVDALDDELLRQPTAREVLRERLQHAVLTAEQKQAAQEHTRREVMGELRAIAVGDQPSGRLTREQLRDGLAVVRAETARRQRQAALAAAGRAEHVPDGPSTHVSWRQRPHGPLSDAQLRAAIGEADTVIAHTHHDITRRLADAAEQLAAARDGNGPSMRALTAQRDQLHAAADAATTLERARQDADAARQAATDARTRAQQLHAQSQRNPLLLRLAGTSRAELAAQAVAAAQQAQRHDHAEHTAQARARHAAPIARATPDAAERLTALHRDWPARVAQAKALDVANAEQLPTGPAITHTREHATRWQRRGDALRAEAALRQRLDPLLARAEDLARQAQQTQQRTADAHGQATQRRAPQPTHDPRPTIDRGPLLGM
jgi:conjugative relaxase-like TrwC/TraI family protein